MKKRKKEKTIFRTILFAMLLVLGIKMSFLFLPCILAMSVQD